jgi:hypothetical protein
MAMWGKLTELKKSSSVSLGLDWAEASVAKTASREASLVIFMGVE